MEKIKKWLADSGNGNGNGYGSGNGNGYGNGSGSGNGNGNGNGSGSGYGEGIKSYNGQEVHMVDDVQTIINHVSGALAKGFILENDFTLQPCYIAKGNGYFAHGRTAKEAVESLQAKIFEDMDTDEAIEKFMETFEKGKSYKGTDFFEWHHYLTGSCLMGRESFVRNHGINLEDEMTVEEFIAYCEDDYGGEIIKELKERWEEGIE